MLVNMTRTCLTWWNANSFRNKIGTGAPISDGPLTLYGRFISLSSKLNCGNGGRSWPCYIWFESSWSIMPKVNYSKQYTHTWKTAHRAKCNVEWLLKVSWVFICDKSSRKSCTCDISTQLSSKVNHLYNTRKKRTLSNTTEKAPYNSCEYSVKYILTIFRFPENFSNTRNPVGCRWHTKNIWTGWHVTYVSYLPWWFGKCSHVWQIWIRSIYVSHRCVTDMDALWNVGIPQIC